MDIHRASRASAHAPCASVSVSFDNGKSQNKCRRYLRALFCVLVVVLSTVYNKSRIRIEGTLVQYIVLKLV